MNASQKVRIESLDTGGWQVQILDMSKSPPKIMKNRYTDMGGVSSMFVKSLAFNTGVINVQLLALATSASEAVYLFLDPAKFRAIRLFRDSERISSINVWTPPAVWIVRTPSASSNKWSADIMLAKPQGGSVSDWKTGHYPMSNTYSNGQICWGSVRFPTYKFPRDLKKVIDLFWSSDFNGHIWHGEKDFFAYAESCKESKVEKLSDEKLWEIVKTAIGKNYKLHATVGKFWSHATKANREDDDGDLDYDEEDND